jgi:GT2 family glycosyltransferase
MNPSLSVVIPSYGRVESVETLLAALDRQAGVELELVVVDQNPDERLAALGSSRFPFRRARLREPNASTARNVGFVSSRHSHLLFIDDDLRPDPEFCARGVHALDRLSGRPCLWALVHDASGVDASIGQLLRRQCRRTDSGTIREVWTAESNAVFMSRETFRATGGFDEDLFRYSRTAEDEEFCIRARRRGIRIWVDTSLPIFHDTEQPGGCELRTAAATSTRLRCMKAWAYRYRVHRNNGGALAMADMWHLCRSAFLNSGLIRRSLQQTWQDVRLLAQAIGDSRQYVAATRAAGVALEDVDYLTGHCGDRLENAAAG